MSRDLPRTILGRTNLEVTRFGIGGTYCETVDGYRAALDCGVNYIDTARSYLGGEDEKVIGQAIQGRRHDLIVAQQIREARRRRGARRVANLVARAQNGLPRYFPAPPFKYRRRNATKRWGPRWGIRSCPTSPRRGPSALHRRHRPRLGASGTGGPHRSF